MESARPREATQWLFGAWLAAVVFVFSIPHTIALRNLLLAAGLGVLLLIGRRSFPEPARWLRPATWTLIALTAWIVFHSVAVAPAPAVALDQFRANWLMPLLLGAIAAWAAAQLRRERAAQIVTLALAAHMIWLLGWQFHMWLGPAHWQFKATPYSWPFKATPFGGYDFQGTLNSFFLALLLADRIFWVRKHYSPLTLDRLSGWVLLLLALISDFALQSRNSTIISLSLLTAASLILLGARSQHWRTIFIVIGVVSLLGIGSFSLDSRWQGLRESAAIGWSSENTNWMAADDAMRPRTSSGAVVEDSAYTRATFARQAVDFIADHPMGIGFGHDAFGHAMALKHGHTGLGSSHSGWLDFAMGTGLIGLALLLAAASVTILGGWREFRMKKDAQALLLVFFVGGYTLRCLLDGHLSGWRLGLFAFIVGVLVAGTKNPRTDS